jgi:ATP-dependent RNA helicase RhlE
MSFSKFDLHPTLLRGVEALGYDQPTPIQTDAIPPGLLGKDLLACAMTGSGKTAAFLLPILHRLIGKPRGVTRALVLAPTRELAAQIAENLADLAKFTGLRGAAVFGGVGMGPQERAFRTGVDVIVATPGRLLDHFQQGYARLSGLEVLVLDEADRMLDMGFLPDIRRVLKHLPPNRQTLFFSATLPAPIFALSREILKEPVKINIDRPAAPATGVTQAIYPVAQELKSQLLLSMLRQGKIQSALVFTRTKHRANRVAEFLLKNGIACDRIHGNRSQGQRTEALARFKSGANRVLVATDIAARGIDVEALSHVINFDVPNIPEDYIHRVGRTARAEATGDAFTFASPAEQGELSAIERAVGKRLPRVTLEGFDYTQRPSEKLEIPIGERIAEIRARKAQDRARAQANAARRSQAPAAGAPRGGAGAPRHGQGRPSPAGRSAEPARPARPAEPGRSPMRKAAGPSRRPAVRVRSGR